MVILRLMVKKENKKYISKSSLLIPFLLMLFSCSVNKNEQLANIDHLILKNIYDSGILQVAIDFNSTNYFVYRGKPMGYQYDLIQALCHDLKVKPEFTLVNNLTEAFEGLNKGQFDLVAKNLTVTRDSRQIVDFIKPLKQTRQVIVQRKISKNTPDSLFLKSIADLAGKKIAVPQNSSYSERLYFLSSETGQEIEIAEDSINGAEQLIAMVSAGEVDYTVCDENLALLNQKYYPNLDVSLKISFPQNIAWAVKKGSGEWKQFLDNWVVEFKKTKEYNEIYYRYFISPRSAGRFNSEFHSATGGKISIYDPLVKYLSAKHNWDWRLISSIMYHESRFDPEAESWGGAFGLMQLMPATAESLGVEDINDPRQNIEGGILLLKWLDEQLLASLPDSTERVKFVLAAYNIGLGHVKDAQRLADKYGKDSQIWENNVDYFMKNKSSEKYIADTAVKWGYARGEEAYNFVNRVTGNYEHYRNLIPE
jgi:membrane-bound lytic murein transglycosylase F